MPSKSKTDVGSNFSFLTSDKLNLPVWKMFFFFHFLPSYLFCFQLEQTLGKKIIFTSYEDSTVYFSFFGLFGFGFFFNFILK